MSAELLILAAILGMLLLYEAADPEHKYLMIKWAEENVGVILFLALLIFVVWRME